MKRKRVPDVGKLGVRGGLPLAPPGAALQRGPPAWSLLEPQTSCRPIYFTSVGDFGTPPVVSYLQGVVPQSDFNTPTH